MHLSICIAAVLVCASVTDIRDHRIPNWLTLSGMVAGLTSYVLAGGFRGLLFSAEGLILGFALLVPFYVCGGMGAGDVKLLAAVGALLGPSGVMKAFLCTALVGGVYALIVLAVSQRRGDAVSLFRARARALILRRGFEGWTPADTPKKAPVLCYGVAIAFGTFLSLLGNAYLR